MTRVAEVIWISHHQQKIELELGRFFKEKDRSLLRDVCEYAVLNGGKRLRALLIYAIGDNNKNPDKYLNGLAVAVELVHAYSLIHDDLPSMDNDDLRRGKPSSHIKFSEAQAILAGDTLQSLAFELLSSEQFNVGDKIKIKVLNILSQSIGLNGMALGQPIDIESAEKELNLKSLELLQRLKTGALIEASCIMSYIVSDNYNQKYETDIASIGRLVGKIYQITDDILDFESDTKTLGKTAGKDAKNKKPTYVSLMGLTEAKRIKAALFSTLLKEIEDFPSDLSALNNLVNYIYKRIH